VSLRRPREGGGGPAARDGGERGACGVVGEEKGGRHPFKGVWRGGSGGGESGQRGCNAAQGGRGGLAPTGGRRPDRLPLGRGARERRGAIRTGEHRPLSRGP
jgi:hypothetical protein